MSAAESRAADAVVACSRAIAERRLSHGSTGNVSARVGDRLLVTRTGAALGDVGLGDLSVLDLAGRHLDGPPPTKEAVLHAAIYRARPDAGGVVHTHSTHAAAVSCLADTDPASALPPLTAYFVMRVGRLPLLPFFAPGDPAIEAAALDAARLNAALLLRNHGPIAAGDSPQSALDVIEEIEETARVFLLLHDRAVSPVPVPGDAR